MINPSIDIICKTCKRYYPESSNTGVCGISCMNELVHKSTDYCDNWDPKYEDICDSIKLYEDSPK